MLAWCTTRNFRSGDNPAAWKNHLDNVQPARGNSYPALPYADDPEKRLTGIANFIVALRQREGIAAQALEFLILTSARTGAVIGAIRDEIDFRGKVWTVPPERAGTKITGDDPKPRRIPLSDRAIEILKALPTKEGNTWLNGSDLSAALSPFPPDLAALYRATLYKSDEDDGPHASAAEFTTYLFRIAAAVEAIPNDDLDNYLDWGEWNRIGMAIWNASDGTEAGFDIFDKLSEKSGKYNSRTTAKRWRSYFRSPPTSVGFGSRL